MAGGIIVVASPSFSNACTNAGTHTTPHGATTHGPGTAGGLLGQIPITSPLNHCGGADLPTAQECNASSPELAASGSSVAACRLMATGD
jgi:hypothetical protein